MNESNSKHENVRAGTRRAVGNCRTAGGGNLAAASRQFPCTTHRAESIPLALPPLTHFPLAICPFGLPFLNPIRRFYSVSKELLPIPDASVSGGAPIEILTPQQLAARLRVKPSWVYEQTRSRSGTRNPDPLPHTKMGLYLRFDWRDVLAWLERQKQHSEAIRTR